MDSNAKIQLKNQIRFLLKKWIEKTKHSCWFIKHAIDYRESLATNYWFANYSVRHLIKLFSLTIYYFCLMEPLNKNASPGTRGKALYNTIFHQSISPDTRETFWNRESKEIAWINTPKIILDSSNIPFYRWFKDGTLNMCYNCIDRHIESSRGDNLGLIWNSAYLNKSLSFTYTDMYIQVNKLSQILINNGVRKGDTVIIYMPMIPEGIFAMLACCRIGAIHSVVFGGFASPELADRINDAKSKIILTASVGIEPKKTIPYYPIVLDALKRVGDPDIKILLVQRPDVLEVSIEELKAYKHTLIFQEEMSKLSCDTYTSPVEVEATHPLYILYTSGTTGTPKGIVHDTGGTCVALNFTMKNIMNIDSGDVVFSTSDIGWIVGHVFIVYGPLLRGAVTTILEGKPVGTPNCGKCFEIIEKYKVKAFYTAPTALRAIKREDPKYTTLKKYDLSSLESIHMAGERCDPDTFKWIQNGVGQDKLINDQWWQTESGWPICCNNIRISQFKSKPGSACKPQPGYDVRILEDNSDKEIIPGSTTIGRVCIALPPPPGFMLTLWGNDEAYIKKYISADNKYYFSGDCGYQDKDGYIYIMSRIDDMIKIAGHRLSIGRMEEVLDTIPEIAESAVVRTYDSLKGELPFAFLVLKNGLDKKEYPRVVETAKEKIIQEIGKISMLKGAIICKRLPKTRSGKIIRGILKCILNKEPISIPSTIEDPMVIIEITKLLYPPKF